MINQGIPQLIPLSKAYVFNTALPTAEHALLPTSITPTNTPSYIRIYVCISVEGLLRVARTRNNTTVTENLNSGVALVPGAACSFSVPWATGDSINFRYSHTSGTIYTFIVDEMGAGE